MQRFKNLVSVVAVLAVFMLPVSATQADQPVRDFLKSQPVRTVIKAKPARAAVRGIYQSVGYVNAGKRNYGSTGGYGCTGTNYGSSGTSANYGSCGSSVSYVLR